MAPTPEDDVEAIQRDNPGWHIWRSKSGDMPGKYWCASLVDRTAGVSPTLVENSPTQLRAQLASELNKACRGEREMTVMAPAW